jgi:hypothetical protein
MMFFLSLIFYEWFYFKKYYFISILLFYSSYGIFNALIKRKDVLYFFR